jgi:hypothetical protein
MSWSISRTTDDIVFIIDNDDGLTITNDARHVALQIWKRYGDRRIVYRDTMGNWDEMVHVKGVFLHFAPFKEKTG